jgi:hypothetical protein
MFLLTCQGIIQTCHILTAFPNPLPYLSKAIELLKEQAGLFSLLSVESQPLERLPELICGAYNNKGK